MEFAFSIHPEEEGQPDSPFASTDDEQRQIDDMLRDLPIEVLEAIQQGEGGDIPLDWMAAGHHNSAMGAALSQCIRGTVASILPFFLRSLSAAFLQFVLTTLARRGGSGQKRGRVVVVDLLNGIIGVCLLCANSAHSTLVLPILLYFAFSCALINAKFDGHRRHNNKVVICMAFTIAFIAICQLLLEPENFLAMRGAWMIAAMKQISLCVDIQGKGKAAGGGGTPGKKAKTSKNATLANSTTKPSPSNILEQFAYVFNPSTLLVGPFITFEQFHGQMRGGGDVKEEEEAAAMPRAIHHHGIIVRVLHFLRHLLLAFLFLLLSTCLLDPLHSPLFSSFSLPLLLRLFLVAFSFRSSHYFICHFSTASALLGGISPPLEIVRWQAIEWPSSMAQVATNWNIPMHTFLHKYVYRPTLGRLGPFLSALFTFLISAALHGLDIQMVSVLLSLGLFAFVEKRLRDRLAHRLSACIRAKECTGGGCDHRRKKCHPLSLCLRLLFIPLNIFLLIYLGAPFHGEGQFRGYSPAHLWHIWAGQFRLSGHLIALAIFLASLCFRRPPQELVSSGKKKKRE